MFPPDFSVPSTGRANNNRIVFDPVWSGKMKVLDYLLAYSRRTCDDRFVLVSNYTQTMDAFEQVFLKLRLSQRIFQIFYLIVIL